MPWIEVDPIVDPTVRGLCVRPYPLHPRGCPNFSHKAGCPPQAPIFVPKGVTYAIYNAFPFGQHVADMRTKHPDWSWRQLRCVLYWQPKARLQLGEEIRRFLNLSEHWGWGIVACPEAQGVNLTATMAAAGIVLEWPPETVAYQIVLATPLFQGTTR